MAGLPEDRSDFGTPEKLTVESSKDNDKVKVDSPKTGNDKSRFKATTTVELPFLKFIDPDNEQVGNDRADLLKMIGSMPNPNV